MGTWQEAVDEAALLGHHLVTVDDNDGLANTGADENAWLTTTFAPSDPDPGWSDVELHQATEFWLGFTDEAEEGLWVWSSGEGGWWRKDDLASTSYESWWVGQPDNHRGNQHYGLILVPPSTWPAGSWDDLHQEGYGGISRRGIIEAIPEPSTVILLLTGALGLLLRIRRRR